MIPTAEKREVTIKQKQLIKLMLKANKMKEKELNERLFPLHLNNFTEEGMERLFKILKKCSPEEAAKMYISDVFPPITFVR